MGSRHAVIVSYLALFVALGGSAAALQGRNSVHADDLAANSVKTRAIAQRTIKPGDIERESISAPQIRDGGIKRLDLHDQSVDSDSIVDGTIRSTDLGDLESIGLGGGREIRGDTAGIRLTAEGVTWTPNTAASAPVSFVASGSGGGLILDGTLGPGSGFIRLKETQGTPIPFANAVSLYAVRDGGQLRLAALLPDGSVQFLTGP